jgi:Mitochondrial glycoprotein
MAARVVKESLRAVQMLGRVGCRQQQFGAWCPSTAPATSFIVPYVNRPFQSSTNASALAKILTEELNFEKGEMDKQGPDSSALHNAPPGWRLDYKTTETTMTLSKMMGNEQVIIRVNTLSQGDDPYENPNPDDNSEDQPSFPIPFTVDSVKGNTALRFECEYIEDDQADPSITDVMLVPNVEQETTLKELEPNMYGGPRYHELDGKLQEEFAQYIADRGIDADMGQYLCRLVYDKEQEDYVNWLERLKNFTAQ